jgi:threonine/homoserine/homoserine lactone efflux protein
MESEALMKLLGILIGFIIAMLGLIIAIHSTSHVVGLLMLFGGMYLTLSCLPAYGERLL